jgi:tetratricopeptide (TPR) repeat protein
MMVSPKSRRKLAVLLCVLVFVSIGVLVSSCSRQSNEAAIEMHKRLAGELQNNRLYQAAVDEYTKVLAYDDLDVKQRANICYLIGRLYFDDIRDYASAAAYFVRAREYDPEGSFMQEASKNLVASLEKLGNIVDAKRQLAAATDIDPQPRAGGDVAVARIGDRQIWLSNIDDQIASLSPDIQKRLLTREAKLEFIRQYVGIELLYEAAVREDYLSNPEIQRQQEHMVKQLLVNKYVVDKVMPQVRADSLDVKNYYQANKDTRYKGEPYDSVRAQVFMDYQNEKAESAYSDYIARLAQTQRVEFLDQNVK